MHGFRRRAHLALGAVLLIAATAAQAASSALVPAHAGAPPHALMAGAASAAIGSGPSMVFAAPVHAGTLPSAAGGLARVALALIVVLAAIFGAGWFSRRVHGTRGARHPGLEVLAQLPLGPRERAVLIRVGAQQLLVGVAGGCVRTLHVCAPDAVPAASAAAAAAAAAAAGAGAGAEAASLVRPTFKSLLLKSLGR